MHLPTHEADKMAQHMIQHMVSSYGMRHDSRYHKEKDIKMYMYPRVQRVVYSCNEAPKVMLLVPLLFVK